MPLIQELPDAAQRFEWSKIINCDESTLFRAEKAGLLEGTKSRSGQVLYTKEAVLAWLGFELVPVEGPVSIMLRPIEAVSRRTKKRATAGVAK